MTRDFVIVQIDNLVVSTWYANGACKTDESIGEELQRSKDKLKTSDDIDKWLGNHRFSRKDLSWLGSCDNLYRVQLWSGDDIDSGDLEVSVAVNLKLLPRNILDEL